MHLDDVGALNRRIETVARYLNMHAQAGVDIVMCGQTAMSRGFYPELLVPEAKVALSAMTALVRYQADGYGLIAF